MKATANFATRLESAIGASSVFADPSVCWEYAVDQIAPAVVARPSAAEQAAEIVRFAALEKLALIASGHRTKLQMGMPPSRYDIALDMTGIHQIAHHDPGDLTVSVDAGTSFNDLAALLAANRPRLDDLTAALLAAETLDGADAYAAAGVAFPATEVDELHAALPA